jgi:AraC-like DNA-binding protein
MRDLIIFSVITCISVFLTLILSIFFFITKRGHTIENKILAILLAIFNLQIIYSYLTSFYAFQYFLDWHKTIFLIRQTSLLIGPLIYLYVISFLKRKDVINYRSLVHFLPFIAVIFFLTIFYRHTDRFIIWESTLDLYTTIIILDHNFFYLVMAMLIIKSMNISFRGLYNEIRISSHYTWLHVLLLGFIVIWIVNLNSFAIYMIVRRPAWCAYTASIYALIVFLFVTTIMFFLLIKPDIYYVITKYKNNKLKEQDKLEYLQRLNSYMETYKPFLNPDISLESLANEISVNPRILSQLINESFKKNFKSFILEYRIKESMQMLADSKYRKHTVLEILYEVGFNSKSAFNNQFKLFTNLTPLEYRAKFIN